jgi:predicted amidophosphoribosyltransferase
VERGHLVWVYFRGGPNLPNGVYAKGRVAAVNSKHNTVHLKIDEYDGAQPLSSVAQTNRIELLVSQTLRQVFLLRGGNWGSTFCTPEHCNHHRCSSCPIYRRLRRIGPRSYNPPERLVEFEAVVPAYWSIPARSTFRSDQLRQRLHTSSELFYDFKLGEKAPAYPFARGIVEALRSRGFAGFDAIIPIPLSPDKAKRHEQDRAGALARELGRMIGIPVRRLLGLRRPVAKRRMLGMGKTIRQFRTSYEHALTVAGGAHAQHRVLLVDDTCTHGYTLQLALEALRQVNPSIEAVAAVATQMITKSAVRNPAGLYRRVSK